MTSATILVVDDERNIRGLLRMYLEQEGYQVHEAVDGEAALQMITQAPPDMLILDLMMPGVDGWDVCRRIRGGEHANIPILMLTARDDDIDKIIGLELGADDYVTKPFNPREVIARVKAVLRRSARNVDAQTESATTLHFGNVNLDSQRRTVTLADKEIDLRRKEFDLLETFLRQPEIVLNREQLLEQVWGYDYLGQTRTVDVHIAALRRKLIGADIQIETITGVGYRLSIKDIA